MSEFKSCSDITFCSQSRGLVAFCYSPERPFFPSCSVFWSTGPLRRNDWSSNNRPVKQLWQHKNVNIKSLVILPLLPRLLFSLIKSPRSSPGSGKLISLNTFPPLILFFPRLPPSPLPFLSLHLALVLFHVRIREARHLSQESREAFL